MRRGQHKGVFKAAITALELDLVRHEADAARTRELIAALMARAEGGTRAVQGRVHDVPPKKRRRRRHKSRPVVVRKAKRGIAAKVATVAAAPMGARVTSSGALEPTVAKAKVRGAVPFAAELKAVDEIVAALAEADKALTRATRAKDTAITSTTSARIHELRREGNELLVRLGGKARLPIDKKERMRWRRAGAMAAPPKPKRTKAPRKPTPPPAPPVVKRTDWHPDENGTMSREIITS